ncbi:enolase C-terminal domain-like protein [Rhizohabitans arisaemae]|uniref:enolase C-terminal domain-like protein n=1 Tax=Rhizohabitans arisaemae TaxID=2720610 RepID=UPI0024B27878|nr:enolase C-terminal domain-like protein [Rhizohabitans arisaemae]
MSRVERVETIEIPPPGTPPAKGKGRPIITPVTHLWPEETGPGDRGESLAGLPPSKTWAVVVRVWDADGRCGVGTVGFGTRAAVAVIEDLLAPIVVGGRPCDVELHWERMYRGTLNIGRKGLVLEAISAVDIALWDLLGHQLGRPVYDLLGGRTRERIPVYASRLYATEDLDALAEEARGYAKAGFLGVKQRLAYGPGDGRAGMRRNLALVRTVADAIGPDLDQMVDAYMGWDVDYAIRMIRMIEDDGIRLRWVEEPVIPDNIPGYAEIRRAVNTPISGGEHEFTRYGFRDLFERRAVDIAQPDVNRVGGLTEARKICALAAAYDIPVIPHAGQAHNYHLVMSHTIAPMAEHFLRPPAGTAPDEDELFFSLFPDEPDAVDGHISLDPDRPGLGITFTLPIS